VELVITMAGLRAEIEYRELPDDTKARRPDIARPMSFSDGSHGSGSRAVPKSSIAYFGDLPSIPEAADLSLSAQNVLAVNRS
jgi:hypothetical protein